jgi:hypothetical protein
VWHAATIITLLGGCSTTSGLLIADVHRTSGAWVVAIEGVGAAFRSVASDAGLTLGYDRRTYVYPERIGDPPRQGRHYFFLQLPKSLPVMIDTRAIGLDVRASSVEVGVTLGYRAAAMLVPVPITQSLYMRLKFSSADIKATELIYCPEENPCWPTEIPADGSGRR